MRDLSLLGKILVCNSLVVSLFVYKMNILPLLDENYYRKYDGLMQNFIWEGKHPKISLSILQGNKEQGGLGLIDLRTKDKALKINWITQMKNNPLIEALASQALVNEVGTIFWEANLAISDLKEKDKNWKFWFDVRATWSALTFGEPISKNQVKSQIIWLNSKIRINNEPVKWRNWIQAGIIRIEDCLEENNFLSQRRLCQKYDTNIHFTEYFGLIQSIPKEWKRWLKETGGPDFRDWCKEYTSLGSVVKIAYKQLNEKKDLLERVVKKWNDSGSRSHSGRRSQESNKRNK